MKLLSLPLLLIVILFSPLTTYGGIREQLQQLSQSQADTNKVILLSNLCYDYRFVSADSARMFGEMALQLANELKYSKGVAQAYNDLGILSIDKADYSKATALLNESLKIRESLDDLAGMASVYNKLGIIDQKQGRLREALQNQLAALKIYRNLGQDKWIGYSLNNIGIINQNLGNLDKALEYHQEALQYRLKLHDLPGEATSYSNLANLYSRMQDTVRSLSYYEKALSLARQLKNDELISGNLSNMGNIYSGQKSYPEAIRLYRESLEIRERLGDLKGISSSLSRLGTSYTETGRYKEALQALTRSLNIARKIAVHEEETSALIGLARLKALTNQHDSAFYFMQQYIAMKDSAYDERIRQQILELQTRYENEKLAQDLELAKHDKEYAEIMLIQKKTQLLLILFILISLTGAAIFFFYRHQQRQKATAAAEKIRENEARLYAVLEGQEEERRRIARELHDGLGQTLTAIRLNYQALALKLTSSDQLPDITKVESMLDSASSEVRSISHQMMPKELEQFGLIAAVEGTLNLVLAPTPIQYTFEHSGFQERLGNQSELVLFRVLQELVNNVIKHSGADLLHVRLLRRTNHAVLNLTDNGIGFDVHKHEKKGIGLLNIAGRIDGINGHLHFESEPGKGTTVTIRIPVV
ncbi:MAG TPA: sensor histidine kinase [Prolixibacteraceae bacterium]|nr:sensor histidine kinase [Prolixibacteraceae bacterium]